jgi:hypothetical protein
MSKGLDKRKIEDALKRAAEAAKTGGRDARSGKFLISSRLASASVRPDQVTPKK